MAALAASVENRCRLVSRPDLDFFVKGSIAATSTHIRALDCRGVGVFKGFGATEDVVDLFALQVSLVLKSGVDDFVDVGTSSAEEAQVS